MRENIRKYKKTYFPAVWIYSGSFLLGILIPNIIWKTAWNQKAAASIYLLSIFAGKDLEDQKYFIQVLKMRASIFILAALCGHDLSFSESERNYNYTPDDGRLTEALWSVTC